MKAISGDEKDELEETFDVVNKSYLLRLYAEATNIALAPRITDHDYRKLVA